MLDLSVYSSEFDLESGLHLGFPHSLQMEWDTIVSIFVILWICSMASEIWIWAKHKSPKQALMFKQSVKCTLGNEIYGIRCRRLISWTQHLSTHRFSQSNNISHTNERWNTHLSWNIVCTNINSITMSYLEITPSTFLCIISQNLRFNCYTMYACRLFLRMRNDDFGCNGGSPVFYHCSKLFVVVYNYSTTINSFFPLNKTKKPIKRWKIDSRKSKQSWCLSHFPCSLCRPRAIYFIRTSVV